MVTNKGQSTTTFLVAGGILVFISVAVVAALMLGGGGGAGAETPADTTATDTVTPTPQPTTVEPATETPVPVNVDESRLDPFKSEAFGVAGYDEFRDLQITDQTLIVNYTTVSPENMTKAGREIGGVANGYQAQVEKGWQVHQVEAHIFHDGQVVATFEIEREWAWAYTEGHITQQQYANYIVESVTVDDEQATNALVELRDTYENRTEME